MDRRMILALQAGIGAWHLGGSAGLGCKRLGLGEIYCVGVQSF